jgi:hypothetical protein
MRKVFSAKLKELGHGTIVKLEKEEYGRVSILHDNSTGLTPITKNGTELKRFLYGDFSGFSFVKISELPDNMQFEVVEQR